MRTCGAQLELELLKDPSTSKISVKIKLLHNVCGWPVVTAVHPMLCGRIAFTWRHASAVSPPLVDSIPFPSTIPFFTLTEIQNDTQSEGSHTHANEKIE